jgi:hypothetical protein
MKEVIAKLNELIDTEKTSRDESDNNFAGLMAGFKSGLGAIQNAIISSAAASDAQRLSLAMRAEKLAAAEARRRALAEKEARQEADEMRKAQLAGEGATGIDLSSFQPEEEKGFLGIIIASITGLVTSIVSAMTVAGMTFKEALKSVLGKRLKSIKARILKPFTAVKNFFGKIGKAFTTVFGKINKFFKSFSSKIGNLFKSGGALSKAGGIFKKVFGVIGKLGGVLGRLFAPLGVILGAFAGIFDAVKAFQNEEGDLLDKIVAGISGFFQGFVGFAIGGLLDLGKNLLAWLLGVFGVSEEKLEALKAFSVTDFLKDLIGNIFDGIDAFFTSLFDGMFEGFNNTEGNLFEKFLGGFVGLATGMFQGIVDFWANIIDGIAGFFGNEDFSFKEWITGFAGKIWDGVTGFFKNIFEKGKEAAVAGIMAYVNLGRWIAGYAMDIWDNITGFFKNIFERGKETAKTSIQGLVNIGEWTAGFAKDIWDNITGFFKRMFDKAKEGADVIREKLVDIGQAILKFIGKLLPDRDSVAGKAIAWTGIYDKLGIDGSVSDAEDTTFVDDTAIIPPKSNVGEALTQAGNMTNATSITVVNNNGGNVTNTTTSNQTNNTRSASPPVLSGSAMAM